MPFADWISPDLTISPALSVTLNLALVKLTISYTILTALLYTFLGISLIVTEELAFATLIVTLLLITVV